MKALIYIVFLGIIEAVEVEAQQPTPFSVTNSYKQLTVTFDQAQQDFNLLSKSSPSPEDIRKLFIECMHLSDGRSPGNLATDRDTKFQFLLKFLVFCKNLEDPKFNINDTGSPISLEAPVPPDSGIIPGQNPDQVKDPKLRAAYLQLIQENNAKLAYYNMQTTLINLQNRCIKFTRFYIKSHYGDSDLDQVKKTIANQLGNDPDTQKLLQVK